MVKKKTVLNRLNQPVHPVLSVALIVLVAVGVITFFDTHILQWSRETTLPGGQQLVISPRQQNYLQPTAMTISSAYNIPTNTPTPPPHTTFISDKLGMSFTYMNVIGERMKFYTKEIGNTAYLYYNLGSNQPFSGTDAEFLKTIPGHGFSVEVFNKDPQLSLTDAIRKQFLTGYSETDCTIEYPYRKGEPREDMSYQTATIKIFRDTNDTWSQLEAKLAKCPKGYTESGRGILYFMMDPKHPDKLLFVRVGQSNITSGVGGLTWDGTIKVLK